MNKFGNTVLNIVGGIFVLLIVAAITLAMKPIPQDEILAPEDYGVGSSSNLPSYTGLQREFPPINETAANPSSPEKVKLGYNLFFDPVLSEEDNISCATCHHPDLGFSDGLPQSIGRGGDGVGPDRDNGINLKRNAPTLWNVGYTTSLFWDGRVDSLENQALVPLHHNDEMAANTETIIKELQSIPEYVELFDAAFGQGAESVTQENVVAALASFERTLTSTSSPFDRYARGELEALTPQQLRGLNLFRSSATRCFECHASPTFQTETFRIIGVPDYEGVEHDAGREAVSTDGKDGAFKVPTLRNIALTGPYMHNGVFTTLEEVLEFYADGGGVAHGLTENLDPFIQGFALDEQEMGDMIAFLYALTDESNIVDIPNRVPSGLPVVESLENHHRKIATEYNIGSGGLIESSGEPLEYTVQPGQSVQEVVDLARSGDTVLIPYGTYSERVVVNLNGITILGVPNADGELPIFNGENELTEGFVSSGSEFEIGYLSVINYTDNGVIVEGSTDVHMHHMYVENTGTYGLYPVRSTGVIVEDSTVVGADDAGIYAGQSENVIIRNNVVYENVLGIETENTVNSEVYGNYAYHNTNGILVVVLPQLTSDVSLFTKVYDNEIESNNHENFAKPNTAAALMPPGAGLVIVGSDHVEVYDNRFSDNKTAAIGIFDLRIAYDANEIDVGPRPEHIYIHDNSYTNNGYDPDKFVTSMGLPGTDIFWDISGINVRVDDTDIVSFPAWLPKESTPDFIYNIYWNFWNILISLLI